MNATVAESPRPEEVTGLRRPARRPGPGQGTGYHGSAILRGRREIQRLWRSAGADIHASATTSTGISLEKPHCPRAACDGWAVRLGSVTEGRTWFALALTIIGATSLISGLMMVVIGETMRLKSGQGGQGLVRAGEFTAISGLTSGIALLIVVAVGLGDRAGQGRRVPVRGAATGPVRAPAEPRLAPLSAPPPAAPAAAAKQA